MVHFKGSTDKQPFHADITQVLVDGISKSALEAAVELVYTGAHLVGRHGVSVEEVVEAGAALGLPFSAENVYSDSEKTIFEVTPAEPCLHLGSLEHSSRVSKALESPVLESAEAWRQRLQAPSSFAGSKTSLA